jgi:hypothetical protein
MGQRPQARLPSPEQQRQAKKHYRRRNFVDTKTNKTGASNFLVERQVCLDPSNVRGVNARRFTKPAFALRILGGKQMAARRVRPQNFATCGDLEAFRH